MWWSTLIRGIVTDSRRSMLTLSRAGGVEREGLVGLAAPRLEGRVSVCALLLLLLL